MSIFDPENWDEKGGGMRYLTDAGKAQFVDKYFRMNPLMHALLFSGASLRNGMFVLPGDAEFRQSLNGPVSPELLWQMERCNRWCWVSSVVSNAAETSFIGTYEDGSQHKIICATKNPWIVQIDTIPSEDVHNQIRVEGKYMAYPHPDGTTSVVITEANGTVTEFIVSSASTIDPIQKVKSDKTFKDLVAMDLPVVNPKAPLFEEPKIERHDPSWALKHLKQNPPPSKEEDPFTWLNRDSNPTRTDIPIYKEPTTQENMLVVPDPTEGAQDSTGELTTEKICGLRWSNQVYGDTMGLLDPEQIHVCVRPASVTHDLHRDEEGAEYRS